MIIINEVIRMCHDFLFKGPGDIVLLGQPKPDGFLPRDAGAHVPLNDQHHLKGQSEVFCDSSSLNRMPHALRTGPADIVQQRTHFDERTVGLGPPRDKNGEGTDCLAVCNNLIRATDGFQKMAALVRGGQRCHASYCPLVRTVLPRGFGVIVS